MVSVGNLRLDMIPPGSSGHCPQGFPSLAKLLMQNDVTSGELFSPHNVLNHAVCNMFSLTGRSAETPGRVCHTSKHWSDSSLFTG